jgi:hypothetical protein
VIADGNPSVEDEPFPKIVARDPTPPAATVTGYGPGDIGVTVVPYLIPPPPPPAPPPESEELPPPPATTR